MNKRINIALLDLYNNEPNLGIGNIEEILVDLNGRINNTPVDYKIFNLRGKNEAPTADFDIFISSGGPGSPFEGVGKPWETKYFGLLDEIWNHNQNSANKKYAFFICHSFQMMARFFEFAEVNKRHSRSFGIFPVHKTSSADSDIILNRLPDPFFAADFRSWQVVNPDEAVIKELGMEILALEKVRPYVEYERAIMAAKIGEEFYGVQFHPEADPEGMKYHYRQENRRQKIITDVGEQKYDYMMEQLEDPEKVELTYHTILPAFLGNAISTLTNPG
jgi:homoserine O-succinyltransferase/O-acetyltransferase